jgi:hypothetical protein
MGENRTSKEINAEIKLNVISLKQKESLGRKLTLSNETLSNEKNKVDRLSAELSELIDKEGTTPERDKLMDSYKYRAQEIDNTINENNRAIKANSAQLAQLRKDSNELNKELEDILVRESEAKIRLTKTFVDTTDALNKTLLYPSSLTIVKNTSLEVLTEGKYVYIKLGEISDLIGDTVLRDIDYAKVSFSNGDDTAKYYTTSYSYDLTIEPTSVFLLFDYDNLNTNNTIWALLPQNPYNPS